ncbi:MAG: hypothetical protein IKQ31_00825 [Clostridia bacterium]|nr:hypothetical protein [Clostridia bacterium]
MNKKKLLIGSIVLNCVIILLVAFSVMCFFVNVFHEEKMVGFWGFKYFTTDSNVLLAITSGILLFFEIKALKSGDYFIPKWAEVLKFCGVIAVSVTFWVVVLYLRAPIMFMGVNLILHVIVPVLGFISTVFLEFWFNMKIGESLYGAIPMAMYGIFYWIMTVPIYHMSGEWNDFYQFNNGNLGWLSFSLILLLSILLCLGIWALKRIITKHIN